jgi:hypothetical protein
MPGSTFGGTIAAPGLSGPCGDPGGRICSGGTGPGTAGPGAPGADGIDGWPGGAIAPGTVWANAMTGKAISSPVAR